MSLYASADARIRTRSATLRLELADPGTVERPEPKRIPESERPLLKMWVEEHQDGRPDTWTPDMRKARDETGVWS